MHRCGICNYTPDEGSDLRDLAPRAATTVRWNDAYKGFLCTDCSKSIRETSQDYKFKS